MTAFVISLSWVRYEVAQEVVFWLMGGLDDRTWTHVWMAAPLVAIGLAAAIALARDLDLFTTGEEAAATLGLDVERAKQRVLGGRRAARPARRWRCAASSASSA